MKIRKTTKAQRVALRLMGIRHSWNVDAPRITVRHRDLKHTRVTGDTRRHCPVCDDGVLLVCQDPDTEELSARDTCFLCGQKFRYSDIEKVREEYDIQS